MPVKVGRWQAAANYFWRGTSREKNRAASPGRASDPGPARGSWEFRHERALRWHLEGLECLDEDEVMAAGLIRLAANLGHAPAQQDLAACYHHGTGVPQDSQLAAYWGNMAIAGHEAIRADKAVAGTKPALRRTTTL
jgi:hypothetical protein